MLTVRSSPAVGLSALVALLAALGMAVGLSSAGWVVGLVCGVVTNVAVARGLARGGGDALGPADLVTLTRATLACGVAALTADALLGQPVLTTMVPLAVAALALDAVDGWVARRTRTASAFGARFDGEVDAFLILVLSVYGAGAIGEWVLAIGAARYAFAVAGWGLPWMRGQLPPRYWRKVVAATQGIVLTVAAAGVVPRTLTNAALAVALVLLAESFGRDVWWLWHNRIVVRAGRAGRAGRAVPAGAALPAIPALSAGPAVPAGPGVRAATVRGLPDCLRDQGVSLARGDRPPGARAGRRAVAGVANALALVLVWFALLAPNQVDRLTPGAFLRIPLEGLIVTGLVLACPSRARRTLAASVGVLLGVLTVVKILDLGFFGVLGRPFNLVTDRGHLASAVAFVRDSAGPVAAAAAVVTAGVLAAAVLVCLPLSVGRLTRLLARHHQRSVRTVTGLGVIWIACAVSGLQIGEGEPIASTSAGRLAIGEVHATTAGVRDQQRFDAAAAIDHVRDPADGDLVGLRGKDVLIAFVESYGRIAVEGSRSSPQVQAVLDAGTRRLQASGYSAKSAFLTSPTFGGVSWLAHATLQSGLWVDNQWSYDRLLSGDRTTLNRVFGRAGWRTVAVLPSNRRPWPEGKAFYRFDTIYDRTSFGYAGPKFGFSTMPDQYALSVFQRRELAERNRAPVMAEIDLTSSHGPWAPVPTIIDWDGLGDGSVFDRIHGHAESAQELWRHRENVPAAYMKSIEYSLLTLISFVERYGDDNLVLILLGDHQPATIVSGPAGNHDVPITVIAHDRAVINRISGWGWQDGMRPESDAPVWPMDAFRDRFLAAYSLQPPSISARLVAVPPRP